MKKTISIKTIRELDGKIRSLSFGDALYRVLERYSVNVESLAAKTYIDKRNIYRYLNNDVVPQKATLIQLLVGLEVSYIISMDLLRAAGFILNSSYQDIFYSVLLENPGSLSVIEANELILEMNKNEKRNIISEFKIN